MQTAFSPDGRRILARIPDEREARLFDIRTGLPTSPPLRRHADVGHARFSRDGRLVLACAFNHTAQLWYAATGLPVGPAWTELSSPTQGSFTQDGHGVLLYEGGAISRWDIPPPLEGTPERVRPAVEAATRASLDEYGGAQLLMPTYQPDPSSKAGRKLGPDPYAPVRKRLEELGGPLGAFHR